MHAVGPRGFRKEPGTLHNDSGHQGEVRLEGTSRNHLVQPLISPIQTILYKPIIWRRCSWREGGVSPSRDPSTPGLPRPTLQGQAVSSPSDPRLQTPKFKKERPLPTSQSTPIGCPSPGRRAGGAGSQSQRVFFSFWQGWDLAEGGVLSWLRHQPAQGHQLAPSSCQGPIASWHLDGPSLLAAVERRETFSVLCLAGGNGDSPVNSPQPVGQWVGQC